MMSLEGFRAYKPESGSSFGSFLMGQSLRSLAETKPRERNFPLLFQVKILYCELNPGGELLSRLEVGSQPPDDLHQVGQLLNQDFIGALSAQLIELLPQL